MPGLYKIFDEIIVNASDNKQRDPTMDTIKASVLCRAVPASCACLPAHHPSHRSRRRVHVHVHACSRSPLTTTNPPKTQVEVDQENNTLSVWNNGSGIPVVIHKEHQVYVPELIFGNLLTGACCAWVGSV